MAEVTLKTKDNIIRKVPYDALRRIPYFGDMPEEFFESRRFSESKSPDNKLPDTKLSNIKSPDNKLSDNKLPNTDSPDPTPLNCPLTSVCLDYAIAVTDPEQRKAVNDALDYVGIYPIFDEIRYADTVSHSEIAYIIGASQEPIETIEEQLNGTVITIAQDQMIRMPDGGIIPRLGDAIANIRIMPDSIKQNQKIRVPYLNITNELYLDLIPVDHMGCVPLHLTPGIISLLQHPFDNRPSTIPPGTAILFDNVFVDLGDDRNKLQACKIPHSQYVYETVEFNGDLDITRDIQRGMVAIQWETAEVITHIEIRMPGQTITVSNHTFRSTCPVTYGYRPITDPKKGFYAFGWGKDKKTCRLPTLRVNGLDGVTLRTGKPTRANIMLLGDYDGAGYLNQQAPV